MWINNCSTSHDQMSAPNEGSSFSSPRVRFPPARNNCNNNNTQQLQSLFLQPLSPRCYCYDMPSPVYAFPYQMGSPLNYQSPRGIGRIFGLVPATPRSPLTLRLSSLSPRLDDVAAAFGPWVVEAAAVLSPAVVVARAGLNVSSMSTARGINYGPVAEDFSSSLKMDRFKVRIVELGDHDDDGIGHKS